MSPKILLMTALLGILPISELRGAIPFAIINNIPWYIALPYAVFINILAAPICWFFLSSLHLIFMKLAERPFFSWYKKLFNLLIERARRKLHKNVEKWGWLGAAVFIAIPLPFTGAWTGTLGAWVLGLPLKKTMLAVILGVICAGIMVTLVVTMGIRALEIFIKQTEIHDFA